MNDAKFWKAHEKYYEPPDDETDEETCEFCNGKGRISDEGQCDADDEPILDDCHECGGFGTITVSRSDKKREAAELKADYQIQLAKDRRAEEED